MNPQVVIRLLAVLTFFANTIALGLILYFLAIKFGLLKAYRKRVNVFLSKYALSASFIVALVATSGSLYLSEVAHFEPCVLCWYQRIFMYPQVVILGIALWKKHSDVWRYSLPLSLIGGAIAIYHYYMQINPEAVAPCSAVGFSVSCSERFFTYFGYITIPWMSFSAFLLISLGMLLLRKNWGDKGN